MIEEMDIRKPLAIGEKVTMNKKGPSYIIDRFIARGGFSLTYIAHKEGIEHYVVLKEFFPSEKNFMTAERKKNGKIAVCNSKESGVPETWKKAAQHEADMSAQANRIFNAEGKTEYQNDADILHVEGPYEDTKGNLYLVIDTYMGFSLRDLIESGFLRDESGQVHGNGILGNILEIEIKIALRLEKLHCIAGILHLDLSPDNIYTVRIDGGTVLSPRIIDYGSAREVAVLLDSAEYPFTCNAFSAPEITALAELNNLDCGYFPDESSDTYSVVAILFYASTGIIFTSEMRIDSEEWKKRIRDSYPAELYDKKRSDSFAESLIAFFEKGLAVVQQERFTSAESLREALCDLKAKYMDFDNPLSKVSKDEQMSYLLMDKNPLYRYKSEDGNIHALILGSGRFTEKMILSMLSCGQMIGCHLNIHSVSLESEEDFYRRLTLSAPELIKYSNLSTVDSSNVYVSFFHTYVPELSEEICTKIAREYRNCKYIVISTGSDRENAKLASLYAQSLIEASNVEQKRTLISYFTSKDELDNESRVNHSAVYPSWMHVEPFGYSLLSYNRELRDLGYRAMKVEYLYDKLSNPWISFEKSADKFEKDEYSQRSSCAAALHLKYKLASVGIDLSDYTDKGEVIRSYQEALMGDEFGALLELEHRRWMMYMIADGYKLASREDMQQYGFEKVDGIFNAAWKIKSKKLHHCLVPCGTEGIVLDGFSLEEWKHYDDGEKIKAAGLDPLDKKSLEVHLLAKEKMDRILQSGKLKDAFDEIKKKIEGKKMDFEEGKESGESADETKNKSYMLKECQHIQDEILPLAEAFSYGGANDLELSKLQRICKENRINIEDEIINLTQMLSVFTEYASYKDYKQPDAAIIENLLWVQYADNRNSLIKLKGRTVADNITGPLLIEPQRLFYFGMEPDDNLVSFFQTHGHEGEVQFFPCRAETLQEACRTLSQLTSQLQNRCIIDVTGVADEILLMAAMAVAREKEGIAFIRSRNRDESSLIENILGFAEAPVFTMKTAISAKEIYELYGGREDPTNNKDYMLKLDDSVERLWEFYREFQADWVGITAFFSSCGQGDAEQHFRYDKDLKPIAWRRYERKVDEASWTSLNLESVFREMEKVEFIKDVVIQSKRLNGRGITSISFLYPGDAVDQKDDSIFRGMNGFFNKRMMSFLPFSCEVNKDKNEDILHINIKSSANVRHIDWKAIDFADWRELGKNRKRYTYASVLPALRRLNEIGMISDLDVKCDGSTLPVQIEYTYENLAVKDCLTKAGNILELYVWHAARQTGFFDDCRSNFSFRWKEGIQNELDVILTKGLTSLVISCKTAKFRKDHLEEIKNLTERFSLNSKAVIVYSSNQAIDEYGRITDDLQAVKERAKALKIYLIDLNELEKNGKSLGDKLVCIAKGEDDTL